MKVITEAMLRDELRGDEYDTYYVPEGMILSPAGREYLQMRKIKIAKGTKPPVIPAAPAAPVAPIAASSPVPAAEAAPVFKPKYTDYDSGACYMEKPEHMTQLYGNVLVPKDHPRIIFRGKMDALQALVVLDQAIIAEGNESNRRLVDDLTDILGVLREMTRCEILNEDFKNEYIIGLNHVQLRERSHDPMKYYKIKQMLLPDYTMGRDYALLNQLRTAVRETEVAAISAFREGMKYTRRDIVEELNRMSSAMHIMMCMYLAGEYNK